MRAIVCGSRKWSDRQLLFDTLDHWHAVVGFSLIIEGCAQGADQMAEQWARSRRVKLEHFPSDWLTHGISAGFRRNNDMLIGGETPPHMVLAFHDPHRGGCGTEDMIHKAQKADLAIVRITHGEQDAGTDVATSE